MIRRIAAIWVTCCCLLGPLCRGARGDEPRGEGGKQIATKLDAQVHVTLKYLIYLPADYDKQEKWPLILFLHGAGERGDNLDAVKRHGPPKLIEQGKQFPFIVVSPQCPNGHWWNNELVAAYGAARRHRRQVQSRSRPGLSHGPQHGRFWHLAAGRPIRPSASRRSFRSAAAANRSLTRRAAEMPVWAFHGGKDPVVPVRRSQDLIDALKKTNDEAKLTIYPEALHDSWTRDVRRSGNLRVAAQAQAPVKAVDWPVSRRARS